MTNPRPSVAYLLTGMLSWPVVRFLFRTRWEGRELVPASGGYVLAANHNSNFDAWPLVLGLFPRRYMRFMAKSELFWPPLGAVLKALGGFKVHRGEPDRSALTTAVELCREGHIVVMFPEGTRRRKGLWKQREPEQHTGAARIALRAGVPLVPAAVRGTDRLSRLGPIRVAYGRPIPIDDLYSSDRRTAAARATDRVMAEIARLEDGL
jgi:1-acyl-sn-glycerol-3-phosphate acyltransferase